MKFEENIWKFESKLRTSSDVGDIFYGCFVKERRFQQYKIDLQMLMVGDKWQISVVAMSNTNHRWSFCF